MGEHHYNPMSLGLDDYFVGEIVKSNQDGTWIRHWGVPMDGRGYKECFIRTKAKYYRGEKAVGSKVLANWSIDRQDYVNWRKWYVLPEINGISRDGKTLQPPGERGWWNVGFGVNETHKKAFNRGMREYEQQLSLRDKSPQPEPDRIVEMPFYLRPTSSDPPKQPEPVVKDPTQQQQKQSDNRRKAATSAPAAPAPTARAQAPVPAEVRSGTRTTPTPASTAFLPPPPKGLTREEWEKMEKKLQEARKLYPKPAEGPSQPTLSGQRSPVGVSKGSASDPSFSGSISGSTPPPRLLQKAQQKHQQPTDTSPAPSNRSQISLSPSPKQRAIQSPPPQQLPLQKSGQSVRAAANTHAASSKPAPSSSVGLSSTRKQYGFPSEASQVPLPHKQPTLESKSGQKHMQQAATTDRRPPLREPSVRAGTSKSAMSAGSGTASFEEYGHKSTRPQQMQQQQPQRAPSLHPLRTKQHAGTGASGGDSWSGSGVSASVPRQRQTRAGASRSRARARGLPIGGLRKAGALVAGAVLQQVRSRLAGRVR